MSACSSCGRTCIVSTERSFVALAENNDVHLTLDETKDPNELSAVLVTDPDCEKNLLENNGNGWCVKAVSDLRSLTIDPTTKNLILEFINPDGDVDTLEVDTTAFTMDINVEDGSFTYDPATFTITFNEIDEDTGNVVNTESLNLGTLVVTSDIDPATGEFVFYRGGVEIQRVPNCCNVLDEITDADLATAGSPVDSDIANYVTANNLKNTKIYYIGNGTATDPDYTWYVDSNGDFINDESPAAGGGVDLTYDQVNGDRLTTNQGNCRINPRIAQEIVDMPFTVTDNLPAGAETDFLNTTYTRKFANSIVEVEVQVNGSVGALMEEAVQDDVDGIVWRAWTKADVNGDVGTVLYNSYNNLESHSDVNDTTRVSTSGDHSFSDQTNDATVPIRVFAYFSQVPTYSSSPNPISSDYDIVAYPDSQVVITEYEVIESC